MQFSSPFQDKVLYKAPSHIRVRIDYEEEKIPFLINYLDDDVDIIKVALDRFGVPQEEVHFFELIIKDLGCRVSTAKELLNNEVLVLKKKEIIYSLSSPLHSES